MPDDPKDTGTQGGFDDWLEEEPGPDTDPYAALAEDEVETEISDWMAFTEGTPPATADDAAQGAGEAVVGAPQDHDGTEPDDTESGDTGEAVEGPIVDEGEIFDKVEVFQAVRIPPPDDTGEVDDVADADSSGDGPGDGDTHTTEIPIVDATEPEDGEQTDIAQGTTVDVDEWVGGDRADTDEVPIVAGAAVVSASVTNLHDQVSRDGAAPDEDLADDTGEMEVVVFPDAAGEWEEAPDEATAADQDGEPDDALSRAGFADLWDDGDDDAHTGEIDESAAGDDDAFELTQGDYLHTATREHEGLAAAIAEAEGEETAQVALAAPIPGLESTVVGFDDVVEAEGHGRVRAQRGGDLLARVITAVVLIIALGASLIWRPALLALATVVFVIGAGEFYTALARTGRHPISVFGFIGIVGASVGAYVWGPIAIPASFLLVTTLLLLFYAVVPGREDPSGNLGLTVSIMAWAGLGTFAIPIVVAEDYQPLIIGVVVVVAAMDIAQYFIGRALGRHQLAPWVSPKKTIEGLVGGVIVALALGALLDFFDPFDLTTGLAIGAAVAVLGPLGDLAMSAGKRALALKDMGSILPGHGGFMDRIDGLLFVIPAAWAILLWAGLL